MSSDGPATARLARIDSALCVLIAAVTVAVYARVTTFDFTNVDDPPYVTANERVTAGLSQSGAGWAFTTFHEANWHPLTWLSLMLDATIAGRGPRMFHLTNLILHAANSVLLFLVLRRATGSRWRSAFVSALFALHPLHVESVAWIAERKDVLSTFFWFLALLGYVRYAERPSLGRYLAVATSFILGLMSKPMVVMLPATLLLLDYWPLGRFGGAATATAPPERTARRGPRRFRGASPITAPPERIARHDPHRVAGASPITAPPERIARHDPHRVAGSTAATVPDARIARDDLHRAAGASAGAGLPERIARHDLHGRRSLEPASDAPPRATTWLALVQEKVPLFVLSGLLAVIALLAQRSGGALRSLEEFPPSLRAANALVSCLRYIGKMFLPIDLAVYYPYARGGIPFLATVASAAALLGITAFAVWCRRDRPYLLAGWLWFLLTLAPVIGLIQIGRQAMADRYTYVPLVGLFVALTWWGADLVLERYHPSMPARGAPPSWVRVALLGLVFAVLASLSVATSIQVGYWRDSVTLLDHALAVTQDNEFAHTNLGTALHALGRVDEAAAHWREALRIEPDYADALSNLSGVLIKEGRNDEGVAMARRAIARQPDLSNTHTNLGLGLTNLRRLDEAIAEFTTSLRLHPGDAGTLTDLGNALSLQGKLDEAGSRFLEALRIDPAFNQARYNLGVVRARQGRRDEAAAAFREVLRSDPKHERARRALAALEANAGSDTTR